MIIAEDGFTYSPIPPEAVAAVRPILSNLVEGILVAVKAENPAGLGFGITVPGTYARLAADAHGKYGHRPLSRHG